MTRKRRLFSKKSLLLESLFLVFGLVTMVTSALGQTMWEAGWEENTGACGTDAAQEATVDITLTSINDGRVAAGSEFLIYFTSARFPGGDGASLSGPPINVSDISTVNLSCYGYGSSPWATTAPGDCGNTFAQPYLTATAIGPRSCTLVPGPGPALHIPFAATTSFAGPAILNVTANVNAYNSPGNWLYPNGGYVYAIVSVFTPAAPAGAPFFPLALGPSNPSGSYIVLIQPACN